MSRDVKSSIFVHVCYIINVPFALCCLLPGRLHIKNVIEMKVNELSLFWKRRLYVKIFAANGKVFYSVCKTLIISDLINVRYETSNL